MDQGLEVVIMNPCHIMDLHDAKNWAQMFTMIVEVIPGVPMAPEPFVMSMVAKAHIVAMEKGTIGENGQAW